jgi:hypothetical protein
MHMVEKLGFADGMLEQSPLLCRSSRAEGLMDSMELNKLCAYNQTRECFLGLEVAAGDLSYANVRTPMTTLALKSGEGLWMSPFRAVPEMGPRVPLDLMFLDEDCRVVGLVESYPTFHVPPFSPKAASVLALPAHSIYSSQTQAGDQLLICAAEEMERRLKLHSARYSARYSDSSHVEGHMLSAALLREAPLWSDGPGLLQWEDRSKPARYATAPIESEQTHEPRQTHEMNLVEPGMKAISPPKNWLQRWWSPDPRKAPREPASGLAAYYWTGGAPEPAGIRDISATGLYLVTEERWYPGTLILMTLTRMNCEEAPPERSIAVHSRAVRWGNDGVGVQFVLAGVQGDGDWQNLVVGGLDRKELDRFLQGLKQKK